MAQNISLSTELSQNIDLLHRLLPLGKSFDLITRDLRLGETPAFWLGINGFCNTEILQQIFSDLQDPRSPALCAEQARLCPGVTDLLCG